ncbi:MAG TPA: N-acetyl-gamma-glutamyl-phosphate reductase [Opitutales bacterium]|jgi:N-acetyl-gamma-glutamyl-phosphate reductase|nr:N-acetyl-gamma-glutamyl-phosphate reductase [Opitutales bacterium]
MNVGIVGASGYSGEELVRLLARHPRAKLLSVTSRTLAGQPVAKVLPRLRGAVAADLIFTPSEPAALAADTRIDTYFLALPHGVAAEYARPLLAAGKRVIDLSADFRLRSPAIYQEYYQHAHPAPDLLGEAVYALPEIMLDDAWKKKRLLACPGCYPTSVLVPLVPLLRAGVVDKNNIVVNSFSGVSGAGKKAEEDYLFVERAESAKAYGIPKHRHLSEIEEQLSLAAGTAIILQFTPHLAPMRRGIATTIVAKAQTKDVAAVYAAWKAAYAAQPFVQTLPTGTTPDTAHVTGTNRIDIAAAYDPRTGNFVITSAEDNLLKGASGQAVQILNLVAGWLVTDGLI